MTASPKKKVLITLCALLGVVMVSVVSILGTVAYLTSSAAVSNVFTIGKVGITMTESKVDLDGVKVDNGATQVDTNTYHLVPNKTYSKDPRITVDAGSENSYLFVLVRNDLESIEDPSQPTIAQQLATKGWAKYTKASTGWVYVWVGTDANVNYDTEKTKAEGSAFTYTAKTVTPGTYEVFDTFSIAPKADVTTFGAAKVTLTAVAIQDSGFENNVDAAWAAVVETYPYIHTGTPSV